MKYKIISLCLAFFYGFSPLFFTQAFFDEPVLQTSQIATEASASFAQANIFTDSLPNADSRSNNQQNHWGYFLLFVVALSLTLQARPRRISLPWKSIDE